jgi:hypothetical protein
MDAQLNGGQANALFEAERIAKVGVYTNIAGHYYHYSWHPGNNIVVGIGGGPGNHRNFTCNISNQFVVTLAQGGGGLPVGGGGGINAVALTNSVTTALKLRFRHLILNAVFNDLGRTGQQVAFQNTPVVNRHATRRIQIGAQTIAGGATGTFAAGAMRGFVIYALLPGIDTRYRNYDIRENVAPGNREQLRVQHGAVDQATLLGTISGSINVHLL